MSGACLLCGQAPLRGSSWFPPTSFAGRRFDYRECPHCGSLSCDPLPSPEVLAEMYGADYDAMAQGGMDSALAHEKRGWVMQQLDREPPGRFLDYGCGAGDVLLEARHRGWEVAGVEFGAQTAAAVAARTGVRVVATDEDQAFAGYADVLHLGDVVEHLVDPVSDLARIGRLIRPGGMLVAQGPLEAQANLFTSVLKLWLRRSRTVASTPPFHVMLATAAGQRELFHRAGLRLLSFEMREVDWPAPATLGDARAGGRRGVGLFAMRRLSRAASRIAPERFGNRYFYVGRTPEQQ